MGLELVFDHFRGKNRRNSYGSNVSIIEMF